MGEVSDAVLVRRSCNGDSRAFELLLRRYETPVWDLCLFICAHNHHDAQEAAQETFEKAWRGLGSFGGRSTFKSWLLSIARNVCIDRLRKHAPTVALDGLDEAGGPRSAHRHVRDHDVLADIALRDAYGALPKDECEAWFLIDALGCTSTEAARIVGVRAATTMRSRLNRAREQLAVALRQEPDVARPEPHGGELCGLYLSTVERAIVAALIDGTVGAASLGASRRVGASPRRGALPGVTARQHATSSSPFLWSDGQPRLRGPTRADHADLDLVRFFDLLETQVPTAARIVAVVRAHDAPEAERWRASHPRWELLSAPDRSAWRTEAERLLAHCSTATPTRRADQMVALLDAAGPFVWTSSRPEIAS